MQDQQQRIMGYFIEEARDHLNTLEQGLLNLQATVNDPEMINEVFRAAHSVKGGAAMLGLGSIQQTAHRLEDHFKVLKEHPIPIDRDLESLFLKVFDTLVELLDHLQGSFGLTEEIGDRILNEAEPAFNALSLRLSQEMQAQGLSEEETPTVLSPFVTEDVPESRLAKIFQQEVSQYLRQILDRFKQDDDATGRFNLGQLCQQLQDLAQGYNLSGWNQLLSAAKQAVMNPENSYRQLAPVLIREIKAAQDLVILGQGDTIMVGQELQSLAQVVSTDTTEILPFENAQAELGTDELEADELGTDDDRQSAFEALFSGASEGAIPDSLSTQNNASLDFDWLATSSSTGMATGIDGIELNTGTPPSSPTVEPAITGGMTSGPEVGDTELNTLADLFEGEISELEDVWKTDEIESFGELDGDVAGPESGDGFSDFSDLFFDANLEGVAPSGAPLEDDNGFLNDDFLDELVIQQSVSDLSDMGDVMLQNLEGQQQPPSAPPAEQGTESSLQELMEIGNSDSPIDEATETEELETWFKTTSGPQMLAGETGDSGEGALEELGELDWGPGSETTAPQESGVEDLALPEMEELFTTEEDSGEDLAFLMDEMGEDISAEDISGDVAADLEGMAAAPESTWADNSLADLLSRGEDTAIAPPEAAVSDGIDGDSEDPLAMAEEMDEALTALGVEEGDLGQFLMENEGAPGDETSMTADLQGWLDTSELQSGQGLDDLPGAGDEGDGDHSAGLLDQGVLEELELPAVPEAEIDTMFAEGERAGDGQDEDELGLGDLDLAGLTLGDLDSEVQGEEALGNLGELGELETGEASDGLAALGMGDLDELDQWLMAEDGEAGELATGDEGAIAGDGFGNLEDLESLLAEDINLDLEPAPEPEPVAPSAELAEIAVPELDDPNVALDLNGASLRQRDMPSEADDALADLFGDDFPMEGLDPSALPDQGVAQDGGAGMEAVGEEAIAGAGVSWALTVGEDLEGLDELGDLSELIGQETGDFSGESTGDLELDELGDLDALLGSGSGAEVARSITTGELDDLDALAMGLGIETDGGSAGKRSGEISGDMESSDFADLEQMLEGTPNSEEPTGGEDGETLFSELEGLLGETAALTEGAMVSSGGAAAADDEAAPFDDLEALLQESRKPAKGLPPTSAIAPKVESATEGIANPVPVAKKKWRFEETIKVPVKTLDTLNNLVGEMVVNRNSLEQSQERLRQSLENLMLRVQQLGDVGQRMQDLYERSLLELSLLASRNNSMTGHGRGGVGAGAYGGHPEDTAGALETAGGDHRMGLGELELDRFTPFHTQSQEIIELIVRVRESASDIDFVVEEADQLVRNLRQVSTQIQEGLTKSRMVPFAQTADRLYRAVRNVSEKCGKEVELLVDGKNTMIDKLIAEQLYDPITHLVNNAITHGIETPDEREKSRKARQGQLTIQALYQGNQTIISVSDDGAGIDVGRVRQKAIDKGLISAAAAKKLSEQEVYELLFQPGFTTKEQADDFAGRGVGMDVVRRNIQELRGNIVTDSKPGKGTSFTLRLPLNLSICKALQCLNDHAAIAFPMDGVEDMFTTTKDVVQVNSQEKRCIPWRDRLLVIHPLSDLLKYNRPFARSSMYGGAQDENDLAMVILRSAGEVVAIEVDQVLGEQEIVIKQPEGPIPKPIGIAGMTVLGDGQVMPIADVLELIDLATGRARRDPNGTWGDEEQPPTVEPASVKTEPMVLIVDDSITVRELLKMTFLKSGYQVEQARDGQEAWEKLRTGLPCDLVFCDIEMPRMDGLEFLSRLQKEESLSHLPVAMLTSRGADKHRQMATQLGARGYFTKPYLEEALLDAAQRMLQGEVLVTANA